MLTILEGYNPAKLKELADKSVNCVVTSPPYWGLRDYGLEPQVWGDGWCGSLGLEPTPEMFVEHVVEVFREVWRALRDDGTLWLNLGDTYSAGKPRDNDTLSDKSNPMNNRNAQSFRRDRRPREDDPHKTAPGLGPKQLIGIPWRVAFALQADGWILRQDIIWSKPNPMPESVSDRCTKAHEYIFLLAKNAKYYYDQEAVLEPVSPNTHMRLSQNLAEQIGSHRANGGAKTNGPMKAVGRKAAMGERGTVKHNPSFDSSACLPVTKRNRRSVWNVAEEGARPQLVRALRLALEGGLTEEHIKAIRACGLSDAGRNKITQTGSGKNDRQMQELAEEAKAVLGGYYREFLLLDGRNKRSVWTVATQPYSEAHFATFPEALVEPCILAGCPERGLVLDPFAGSGTVGAVALKLGRRAILIEANPKYIKLIKKRCSVTPNLLLTATGD